MEKQLADASCHVTLLQQQLAETQHPRTMHADMGVQAAEHKEKRTRRGVGSAAGVVLAAGALVAGVTVAVQHQRDAVTRADRERQQQRAKEGQLKWTLRALLPLGRT